jgi:nicotinamidase-related amidase
MTNALVVIDVQESFRQRAIWSATSNPDLIDNLNRLVDAYRRAGDAVVWVLHVEPGTGGVFDPALGHVRFIDGLRPPEPGEPVLHKTAHNAFTTTNLQQWLTGRGIRGLTVTGIRTEQCVETTARIASDLGYDVTFVTDATATNPIPHPDLPADATVAEILADPRTLSNSEIVERTERVLAGRFATIRSTASLVGDPAGVAS